LKLGRAQGAALTAAVMKGIPVAEYAPRKAKIAICGNGAASKEQVAMMIQKTLKVDLDPKYLDATDALAIALCHHYQMSNPLAGTGSKTDWKTFLANNPDMKVTLGLQLFWEDANGNKKPMTTASGKDVTEGLEYSALTYIKNKENGSDAKLAALVKAMNNYGKYAQKYFGYGELDSEPDTVSLDASDLSDYASQKSGSTEGLTLKSATLEFESGTTIRVYYTLDSSHQISDYTVTINGNAVTPVYNSSKKAYEVTVENVASNELQTIYEFKAVRKGTSETLTLKYGAYSYAYSKLSNSSTAAALQNLMKAMYWYNQAAISYFN
jgi:hypothetical protein